MGGLRADQVDSLAGNVPPTAGAYFPRREIGRTSRATELEPNHFINADHVVEITYVPKGVKGDSGLMEGSPSSMTITLITGKTIDRSGADADTLFEKLTGTPASEVGAKKRPPMSGKLP